ncbi:Flap-structured DNA-binding and RNA-binding protein [Tilletia horrida]|nr:Flap-structured DNA-binding and RNA-binding protein [Tilletia horrida]
MTDHGSLRPPVSPSPAAQYGLHRASSPGAVGAAFGTSQAPGARSSLSQAQIQAAAAGSRYSLGSKLSSSSSAGTVDSASPSANAMARLSQQAAVAAAHAAAAEQQARSPLMGGNLQMPTPNSAIGRGLRPSSELLNMNHQNTPEFLLSAADAIDKWFEDLQHYEATLEEMAAASLDQNFKEELSAIEQWFRVLSEAERTAALYSLLQEATQVQIRFFITVLQQMARTDPMSALLSPAHANSQLLEQMDQKFAALGLKSPSAMKTSTSTGNIAYRQSTDASGFLSPNAAANIYSPSGGDSSASLAAQRAKLKANRISAPGTLPGERSYAGSTLDKVAEQRDGSRSPQPHLYDQGMTGSSRPKSTGGLSNISDAPPRSPHMGGGPLDDALSPLNAQGATWASLMNTPMVPGFDDKSGNAADVRASLDAAAAQLASINAEAGRNVLLDQDVNKYKRKSSQAAGGNVQGVLSGMFDPATVAAAAAAAAAAGASPNLGAQWNATQAQQELLRQAMAANSPNPGAFNNGTPAVGANAAFSLTSLAPASPNTLAGLQSPSGGMGNPLNMQMMNAMAAMGTLGSVNVNAAQFLAMQQQILQNQQSLAAMAEQHQQHAAHFGGGGGAGRLGGAGVGGAGGIGAGRLVTPNTAQFSGSLGGRRSPRPGGMSPSARGGIGGGGAGGSSSNNAGAAGAGAGEEEVADISMLEDIPSWLRHLRLHKYTPNFESSHWKDMVVMDDKALEEKGVAALGARRKMIKTFEAVRAKYGIKMAGESAPGAGVPGSGSGSGAGEDGAEEKGSGAAAADGKAGEETK